MKHRKLLILLPTVLFYFGCGAGFSQHTDFIYSFSPYVKTDDWIRISDDSSDSDGKAIYDLFYSSFVEGDTAWSIVQRLGAPDYVKVGLYFKEMRRISIGYASEGKFYEFDHSLRMNENFSVTGLEYTLRKVSPFMISGMAEIADESKKAVVKKDGSIKTLAVMDFSGMGISGGEAQALTERLRVELFNEGGFKLLERGMMETILQEQGFQQTGCVDS